MVMLMNNYKQIKLFLFVLQLFFLFNIIFCEGCHNIINLLDKSCFNDVITFNHSYWRAGHACTNNKGEVIVEFSTDPGESKKRLFYGLNKRGRYYFPGEPVFKEIDDMQCQDCENDIYKGRFESRNLLVHLKDDSSREKQYLFSMSSYFSLVELIDIDDRYNFSYFSWNVTKYFQLKQPIFTFEYSLFEIGNDRTYIVAFGESAGKNANNDEFGNTTTIMKFQFDSFESTSHRTILKSETLNNTYDGRSVSAFRLSSSDVIVLLYVEKTGENTGNYIARVYDTDLNHIKSYGIWNGVSNLWVGYGIFVKGIWIKDDYAAFAFFIDGNSQTSLKIRVVKYKPDDTINGFEYLYTFKFSDSFRQDIQSNGLYRLEEDRIVYFGTQDYNTGDESTKVDYGVLHMFLIDFYQNFQKAKIRKYKFYYPEKRFAKEMDASMYNGYILFTATVSGSYQNDTFAIMMIFGFANGTDHEIDISPYLMDTGYYDDSNNLYDYLMSTMTIDDNIFGYEKIEKIRLISICDELLLYKGKGANKEASTLPLNDLFDANHTLLQNRALTKEENKLYILEYQFMVKEPDFTTFYSMPYEVEDKKAEGKEDITESNFYTRNTLDGRVNILKFKLCHKFCINCIEYGPSDNDQRCVNCKDPYTYDYLTYVKNFTGNCVPYDQMYDKENKKLQLCNSTDKYKYYFNKTRNNERICFKYNYECPDEYHFLNETTNECIDYTPLITTIPMINPTTIVTPPTTVIIPPTTVIIPPTTVIIPPTTVIISPTTVIIPPTTVLTPPTTIITPPTTVIIPPTTVITPPTTVVIPPTTIITPPTTVITPPTTIITPPTTIISTIPGIKTTIPIIPPQTTIPEIIPTIVRDECKYGILINYTSSYSNLSNEDIYHIAKENIISSYCLNGSSVIIEASKGYAFQVSNTLNEVRSRDNGEFSSIDMTECEITLKGIYHIPSDLALIVLKFLKTDGTGQGQTFQYEVYHPITHEKLNLSFCDNTTVDVYIPFSLSDELNEIYNNLIDQGYNPLDLNDKFYREICTPYTSENGTDVLLDDREEFIYSSLVNASLCPDGCDYSEYHADKKYIKCECGTNNTDIVTLDIENLSGENVYNSFLSTMKSTNYKVMICYNLVFNFKIFCHNYGSIITLALFCVYFVYIIYYSIKEISPVKISISKILFKEQEKDKNLVKKFEKQMKPKINAKDELEKKNVNYPPKKGKIRKYKNENNNLVTEDIEFIESPNQKKVGKLKKRERKNTKGVKDTKAKNKNIKEDQNIKPSSQTLVQNEIKTIKTGLVKSKKIDVVKIKSVEEERKKNRILDNFELNNLEYDEACELDKRTFCKTYLSVLMREHLALHTFVAWNDYNLFYVKIEKFLILFCTDMTMNGLFFVHESMHKKYTNGEDFTFVQKLPQILFTLIVSHVLEVLLCFLSMTDIHVYEIKELPKDPKYREKIMDILDCIKRKLVAFFVITFLLFLFHWYFISAFCAVYQNTQTIFLRDSFISFLTSLIDPFFIYGFTTILRKISLCLCCRKNCCGGCIYKISDLIPIF